MAESKVLAASIGLGIVGVGVLSMLAGYSIKVNELTRAEAAAAGSEPGAPIAADAAPVVERLAQAAPVVPVPLEAPSRLGAIAPEPTAPPVPFPIPRKPSLPPVPFPIPRLPRLPRSPVASDAAAGAQEDLAPDVDISGRFEPLTAQGDIRSVDFRNGFTFPLAGVGPVTVQAGFAATTSAGELLDFTVDDVFYGDATGDGRDDAVVVYHFTDQWDSTVSSVRLFSIHDGLLEDWGTSWADYWALGNVLDLDISPGLITIDSLSNDQAVVSLAHWAVQGPGFSLQRVEALPPRTYADLTNRSVDDPFDLDSTNGTVRAVVAARGGAQQTFAFDAQAAWSLKVISSSDPQTTLRVWEQASGRLVGDAATGTTLQLAGRGRYVAEVLGSADTTFEIAAADQRTLAAPTWVPKSRIETTEEPVVREVRLQWPEFTSAAGAANLEATNATIRNFVDERARLHQATVNATCELDERSMLVMSYRLTLVSYDLASIEFNEFVCLCENGDHNDVHTLTIDLNTGQRLEVEQLFVADTDAIYDVWWRQLTQESQWATSDDFESLEPVFAGFGPIIVTPDGIGLNADFNTNDGAALDMGTYFWFEDLDGLIDPAIATRAASGAAVPLPIEEGCGC